MGSVAYVVAVIWSMGCIALGTIVAGFRCYDAWERWRPRPTPPPPEPPERPALEFEECPYMRGMMDAFDDDPEAKR